MMAIVEDEVRNESEEDNEIEVVVEDEPDVPEDTDDSDDEDEDIILERKVTELEQRITEDPYNYDEHIDLIQALWGLSSLERWRSAFDRLQQLTALRAEHWLLRLQTEVSLSHTETARENVAKLFQEAALDCYSIPILSEWCSFSMTLGDTTKARAQLDEVLRRAGADPFSGKIFWDAKYELEKERLETIRTIDTEDHKAQKERVLWCLEEIVSRPLLRGENALQLMEEIALTIHDQDYVDKVKKQHDSAADFLSKITPFEDRLLTLENPDDKLQVYQEYIDMVKDLSQDDKYAECDASGILRVLYDRATTDCMQCEGAHALLVSFARHSQAHSSRSTYGRVLQACTRRCPRRATFWVLSMQQAEHEGNKFEQVKSIFETALSKGMESYKENEALWMGYLEYTRRRTAPDNEGDVETLRRTFRLAWDSLAEAWGEEANDCEVPLYWARLEYKVLNDPKQGKMIFEEIFKYGENKTMSKYWEALITLESNRTPPPSENKLRDLMRRALRAVQDYPPAVARLWTDYERDHGHLSTLRECLDACEVKTKEWRDSYQAMKDKMTGNKKQKKQDNKKSKVPTKKTKPEAKDKNKGKRKSEGGDEGTKGKRKKDMEMEVDQKEEDSAGGVKRSHEDEEDNVGESKRQRTDSTSPHRLGTRDACTLFISNLEFKVDEQNLRDKLSQYGDIISLRVRKGIKAFGGSICYCQYKTPADNTFLIHKKGKYCPYCGKYVIRVNSTCPFGKADWARRGERCQNCDAAIDSGWSFCEICGVETARSRRLKRAKMLSHLAKMKKAHSELPSPSPPPCPKSPDLFGGELNLEELDFIESTLSSINQSSERTPATDTTTEAVDEAIKHDRMPLDGRPMFLSRYSAKKSKPSFKYSTEAEKNKLFVKNLPFTHCTKDALAEVFDKYGKLKDVRVVTHKDGKPKGLAYIEYEDEASAAEAVSKTHGMLLGERKLDVALSAPPPRQEGAAGTLGLAKRDAGGGMRRTQLSSFIPSVLQKASTSTARATTSSQANGSSHTSDQPNGSHSNGEEKRPLSNSDFRSLLLKKQ